MRGGGYRELRNLKEKTFIPQQERNNTQPYCYN